MNPASITPVVALLLGACHLGPSARSFEPALGPDGVWADLRFDKGARIQGELLEVQDSALLVLHDDRITLIRLSAIRTGTFRQRGILIADGRFVSSRAVDALALLSRFPEGLSPELRGALLAAYGQSEPDHVP